MDLLAKVFIAAVIIVAILLALYVVVGQFSIFSPHVSKQQAQALVLEDLLGANPTSVVNVTSVTASNYSGSWRVLASVTFNSTTPCPSSYDYSFDYPKFGFVYRVSNTYTSYNNGVCTIEGNATGRFAVAIARSFRSGNVNLTSYVNSAGFYNTTVHAAYFDSLGRFERNFTKVWLVNYTSDLSNRSICAMVSYENGSTIGSYVIMRPRTSC